MTEGIDESGLDRILLDMPEPHKVVDAAASALRPGGILLAYLPTINQTALLRQALDDDRCAVRPRRDAGDHAAHLARRGALGPSGSPHGRPHRLPHHGAAAGAMTGDESTSAASEAVPQRVHRTRSARSSGRSSTGCTASSWPGIPTPRLVCRTGCRPTGWAVVASMSASGSTGCLSTAGVPTGTGGSSPAIRNLSNGKGTIRISARDARRNL